jgi:hypothetical protein
MPLGPSSTSDGVQYGTAVGFAMTVTGLPVAAGTRDVRVTLDDVDPDLLEAIGNSPSVGNTVTIAMRDGFEYTLHDCEAIALNRRTSSVELAVHLVAEVRPSKA